MPMNAGRLLNEIAKVCPVVSTSVGDPVERGTWTYEAEASATAQQKTDADNVVATIPVDGQGGAFINDFIPRFTDAEYTSMWKKRAASIETDNVGYAKLWDQVVVMKPAIDFNSQVAQDLKAALVAAGILTQARADEIFSIPVVAGTRGADEMLSPLKMLYG